MIDPVELVKFILTISGTLAALCVPACSVILFIIAHADDPEDEDRYGSIASLCAVAGILFVITVLTCMLSLIFEACNSTFYLVIFEFVLGCALILLIFLSFTGVTVSIKKKFPKITGKRKLPASTGAQENAGGPIVHA